MNGEKAKIRFTVKGLSDTGISLDVNNGASPFAGKEFVVGATAKTPKGDITIKSMSGEDIVLSVPGNPL